MLSENISTEIKKYISDFKNDILADIKRIVEIKSVYDENSVTDNAPFGKGIREVFDEFINIANEKGFEVSDFDGYALDIRLGDFDEYIGILNHLDVVDIKENENWNTNPFELTVVDEILYARGVNDNKAPTIMSLYALYIAKIMKFPLKRQIRLIVGGAEESSWDCMKHYFSKNSQPIFGFSPDGDFPLVNGEKGMIKYKINLGRYDDCIIKEIIPKTYENYVVYELDLKIDKSFYFNNKEKIRATFIKENDFTVEIKYLGKSSLSRNPNRGINAIDLFLEDFIKIYDAEFIKQIYDKFYKLYNGDKLGIYSYDDEMGENTTCVTALYTEKSEIYINLDIRYVKSISKLSIENKIMCNNFKEVCEINSKRLLFVDKNSKYIKDLAYAYEKVTGKNMEVFTKGAISYARALDVGVAFGPTFEGEIVNSHFENENMKISTILKALEIYLISIYKLCCE